MPVVAGFVHHPNDLSDAELVAHAADWPASWGYTQGSNQQLQLHVRKAIAFDIIGAVFQQAPLRSKIVAVGLLGAAREEWSAAAAIGKRCSMRPAPICRRGMAPTRSCNGQPNLE